MRVSPNARDWLVAWKVYRRFAARPGATHIATAGALAHLAAVLRCYPINAALEFGAGIGTITYLLLTYPEPNRAVVSIERDTFCLDQLRKNIPEEMRSRLIVTSDSPRNYFDLVVIDGKFPLGADRPLFRQGTICFVEGTRAKCRTSLAEDMKTTGLSLHLVGHPIRWGGVRLKLPLKWSRTRLGFARPQLRLAVLTKKHCSIGIVRSV
jgi:hypothetical protein